MGNYYIFKGGRGNCKTVLSICNYLEYMFGGTCEYSYDSQSKVHHYLIRNDDIGLMDITMTNECFINENIHVRLHRMCEEYDGYMRYKYRDYNLQKERK